MTPPLNVAPPRARSIAEVVARLSQDRLRTAAAIALSLAVLTGGESSTAQGRVSARVQTFLGNQLGIPAARMRPLWNGRAIAVSLAATDNREVAVAGAIRIMVPPSFYASLLHDITSFKRGHDVLQIGAFSAPARVGDVAALTLDDHDVAALSRCRPGHCGVQLSREAIERFQRELSPRTSDANDAATRAMRLVLVDLVNGYLTSGDQALMVYADSSTPLRVAQEFKALLESPPAIASRFAPLAERLADFPRDRRPGTGDVIYWSKERLGPSVVLAVTHLAVVPILTRPPVVVAAASKQIYSSHYFDASLGLTFVLDDDSDPAAMYLVYVNRSRVDVFHGLFGGVKRSMIRSRMGSAVERNLVHVRDEAQRRYRETNAR